MVVKMYFVLLHPISQILYIPYMIIEQSIPRQPVMIFPMPFRQLRVLVTCFLVLAGSQKEAANGSQNGTTLNFIVVLLFAGHFSILQF